MDDKQIFDIYDAWKKEQDKLEPCISIRHMASLTGYGHGTLQEALKALVKMGLAEPIATGERKERKRYRMLK